MFKNMVFFYQLFYTNISLLYIYNKNSNCLLFIDKYLINVALTNQYIYIFSKKKNI